MRRLRVAHLVTAMVAGGAELQALALAERLPRDRFEVDFLCMAGAGPYDVRATAAGLRVVHLGHRWVEGESFIGGQRRRFGAIANLLRTIHGRYDIVDAWLYPNDIQAALGRLVTRTPVVMTGRRNMQAHDRFGRLSTLVDRVVDRCTDAVVANSQAVADFAITVQGVDPRKVHVIRNGVEPVPGMSDETRSSIRARWGVPADACLVGCIGRLHRIKGQDLLLDAFAVASRDRPGLHLVVVGEGELRPDLEGLARDLGIGDRVYLPGSEPDPRTVCGAFDILAQASRSEGMPNALLEGGAAGLPIIATAVGGTREIVIDGLTGLLAPPEDITAIAQGMARLAADPALRARYGAAVREHVEASFGMERFVREYGDLYLAVARSRGIPVDP